jgi:hypothetical protein
MSTLTSISPLSGPPGTTVTLTGAGFTAGSRAACPALAPTTYLSAVSMTVQVPVDLAGPAGGTIPVGIFVVDPDGTISAVQIFTVQFPDSKLQSWTSIGSVCGEVPGFQRGGQIDDRQIQVWIESIAQEIAGLMLRRGLPLDSTQWQQPTADAWPTPAGLLEMINRLGAAAQLAATVAAQFTGQDLPIRRNLQSRYDDCKKALLGGDYDKLFLPSAATLAPGPQFAGGNMTSNRTGRDERSFRKDQVF